MNSSVDIDNKNKNTLALGKGPIQGLDNTTLTTEAKYSINFTKSGKIFVLNFHYIIEERVCYLLMPQK